MKTKGMDPRLSPLKHHDFCSVDIKSSKSAHVKDNFINTFEFLNLQGRQLLGSSWKLLEKEKNSKH